MLKHGQKYNSFYEKIKHYQLGKLLLERNAEKKQDAGEYSSEYYSLTKAKKDIKDKIKESIDAALIFTEIVRIGEYSRESRAMDPTLAKWFQFPRYSEENPNPKPHARDDLPDQMKKFVTDLLDEKSDLAKYELTGDKDSVRNEISDEAKEFVTDVFNKERIEGLLDAIFFHGYHQIVKTKQKTIEGKEEESFKFKSPIIDEDHRNYQINVAKMMAIRAMQELKANLDTPYSEFLSNDLDRAIGICKLVGMKAEDKESSLNRRIQEARNKN